MNSPPASLLIYIDSPNVRNISRNYHATPTESLDCDGYANKNLLDICTTTTKYLFSTLETCFMSYRSISSTSTPEETELVSLPLVGSTLASSVCTHRNARRP